MNLPDVAIIHTGTANLASMQAALLRAGAGTVRIIEQPDQIAAATHLVLPGVGTFGATLSRLRAHGLDDAVREWIAGDHPLLAVCVGLQVLAEASEESPGVRGLGIVGGTVHRLAESADLRVPQMGWNGVHVNDGASPVFLASGNAYFANSYALDAVQFNSGSAADAIAHTHHGRTFVSAFARSSLVACQFHPELSGNWGLTLMQRWLGVQRACEEARTPTPASRLTHRIIPCLDVRDGRVVKGIRFQNLRDAGDPVECAQAYEAQGADELVMLDVSATHEARAAHVHTIQAIRAAISIPLTVGGGVRTVDDAAAFLAAGADKVAVNTAAVTDPTIITAISERFGRQCAILAIDAAAADTTPSGYEVVTHAGTRRTGIDARGWAENAVMRGAGEVLLTSFDRDGTRSGYDCALLATVCEAVSVPVIASGGAANVEHLQEALEAGASAVLAASIFHDRETTVNDIKLQLHARGIEVRL